MSLADLGTEALAALTRERLGRAPRRAVPLGGLVRAAVLVPIVDRGAPCLVFGKRSDSVARHRGQIAFPGGVIDAGDPTALDAALREAEEEIGLPRSAVEVLGSLDDTETYATEFVITPFVGVVRTPVAWQPDGGEIERVLEVPVAALLEPGRCRVERWDRGGVARDVYFYDWGADVIWGATARILRQYLGLLAA